MLKTLTVTVHEELAESVAPVKLILVADAGAVTLPLVQVVLAPGVCATTNPDGNVSVKLALVKSVELGLLSEIVKVLAVPAICEAVAVVKPAGFPVSNVSLLMAL